MSTPRNQLRLQAITGSFADILNESQEIAPAPAADINASSLQDILKQTAESIRRIHGADSFTEAQAGVFAHGTTRLTGDMALTGSITIAGTDAELIDKKDGGALKIRAGDLSSGVGSVYVELSGSELNLSDGHMSAAGMASPVALAESSTDWSRYKSIFGEVSLISAISTAAALPTDAKFMFKVASETNSLTGAQLQQVDGTHFSGTFAAAPVEARNENVNVFLNGQLLVSKSYNATDYDYDIAGDGETVSFAFNLQPDDFVTVRVPITVASVAEYVAGNGGSPGGGGGGATNLDGLTDVAITSPTNGQVLKYNGTSWVNDTDSTGGGGGGASSLDGLTDTSIALLGAGDVLTYDGTNWVNKVIVQQQNTPVVASITGSADFMTPQLTVNSNEDATVYATFDPFTNIYAHVFLTENRTINLTLTSDPTLGASGYAIFNVTTFESFGGGYIGGAFPTTVTITTPSTPAVGGYYSLFLLNELGEPGANEGTATATVEISSTPTVGSGIDLNTLDGVNVVSASNGQFLKYIGSTWTNVSDTSYASYISAVGGFELKHLNELPYGSPDGTYFISNYENAAVTFTTSSLSALGPYDQYTDRGIIDYGVKFIIKNATTGSYQDGLAFTLGFGDPDLGYTGYYSQDGDFGSIVSTYLPLGANVQCAGRMTLKGYVSGGAIYGTVEISYDIYNLNPTTGDTIKPFTGPPDSTYSTTRRFECPTPEFGTGGSGLGLKVVPGIIIKTENYDGERRVSFRDAMLAYAKR